MRIKSFYAATVEAALETAREELGPEALLVTSRRTSPVTSPLGKYEVVVGLLDGNEPEPGPTSRGTRKSYIGRKERHGDEDLLSQMTGIRRQIEGLRDFISTSDLTANAAPGPPPGDGYYRRLTEIDMDPLLAREIVDSAVSQTMIRSSPGGEKSFQTVDLESAIASQLRNRIAVQPELGVNRKGPSITALAGPPGAGKTTTIVKLAITKGLMARRPVRLVSADPQRVGGSSQLQSFAAILGVPCDHAETPAALAAAFSTFREQDLVLIDTPGLCLSDLETNSDFVAALLGLQQVDVHLVLAASVRAKDLRKQVQAYERFGPVKLIFTKLDETESFGALYSEAVWSRKPLSFFSTGQRIPEDLSDATHALILDLILARKQASAYTAA